MTKIAIVNYKTCNCASIENMVKRINKNVIVANSADDFDGCTHIILPGVGSFDSGMKNIEELGFLPALNSAVLEEKKPILGICLGMQLMLNESEEGERKGLGWVNGVLKKIDVTSGVRVPHMGWNNVVAVKDSEIMEMGNESRFYFAHSYFMQLSNPDDVLFQTMYGKVFPSGFQAGNIYGVQFHPEKSHKFGMNLIQKFIGVNCAR